MEQDPREVKDHWWVFREGYYLGMFLAFMNICRWRGTWNRICQLLSNAQFSLLRLLS